jgi:hypothetical protein
MMRRKRRRRCVFAVWLRHTIKRVMTTRKRRRWFV